MSEGTQNLLADVRAVGVGLSAVGVFAGELSTACDDFQAEAVAHGWGGMGARMGEASSELAQVVELVTEAGAASERGCSALGNITDVTPAAHVVGHLGAASTEIGAALTAVQEALSNIDEAEQAVEDVGQQGLMQAIPRLREQVLAVQEQVALSKEGATAELTALQDYIQRSATQSAGGASSSSTSPPDLEQQSTVSETPEVAASSPQRPPAHNANAPTPFDKLIDPTGNTRAPYSSEPVMGFFTPDEMRRRKADVPEPRKYSRLRRRMMAAGTLAVLAAEATIGSAANLGSSAGQAMVGLFFGTIATIVGVPEFKKVVRETKPKHQARLTTKERARGED